MVNLRNFPLLGLVIVTLFSPWSLTLWPLIPQGVWRVEDTPLDRTSQQCMAPNFGGKVLGEWYWTPHPEGFEKNGGGVFYVFWMIPGMILWKDFCHLQRWVLFFDLDNCGWNMRNFFPISWPLMMIYSFSEMACLIPIHFPPSAGWMRCYSSTCNAGAYI